jgi:hypothetical protein
MASEVSLWGWRPQGCIPRKLGPDSIYGFTVQLDSPAIDFPNPRSSRTRRSGNPSERAQARSPEPEALIPPAENGRPSTIER